MSNFILSKNDAELLREYLTRIDKLQQREPEQLTAEQWESALLQIQKTGEIPAEYRGRIGVNNIKERKHHLENDRLIIEDGEVIIKGYYDILWESWNSEISELERKYHDVIVKALRYALNTGEENLPLLELLQSLVNKENITAEEVRQALPQLTSILPQKHVMPNNKLANKLTSFDNSQLLNAEAIDLVVSGRGKAEVTTRCILSYEGDSVTLSSRQPFTEYDRNVADAVTSLYEYGDPSHIITPATVYRTMVHQTNRETPSAQTLGAVTRSLDKMRFVRVQIDCTDELTRRKANLNGTQITSGKIDTYLLALDKIEVIASGKKVTAYKIVKAPVLYDYARLTNQVLTVPAKLLDIPNQSNSEQRINIKGYLMRRIKVMQGRTPQSNRILFEKVFEVAGKSDADKNEKKRIRDYTKAVLDYWKSEKFIKGYTIAKDGKSVIGVDIQL